jgi:iron complex outermembrane receptor protein
MCGYRCENFRSITRCRVIAYCIVLLASLAPPRAVLAGDAVEYDIRIARQPLLSATWELAAQAQVSIGSNDTGLDAIMVGPLVGRFSPDEALRRLLSDTGFIVAIRDSGVYEIHRAEVIREPTLPSTSSDDIEEVLVPGRAKVIVYGSRIGMAQAPPPGIFEENSLDQFGVATVGERLNYSPSQPYAFSETFWGDGALFPDLRGFGMGTTTVLINGRWVPSTATAAGLAFDLNTIPLTAVERVDVLHDSAAAAFGVRAIGGVVNIVLKRTHRSPAARIEYGTAAGGGAQRQISLSAGAEDSDVRSGVSVDWFERSELPGTARKFARDQDFRPFGGSNWGSLSSEPGNISSVDGGPLPGLSSSYAAVPAGTSGRAPAQSDFQNTAGQYTLDSLRRFSSIVPATRRLSVAAYAERSFGEHSTAFVELLGARRLTDYQFRPPTLAGELVPASNAFNPFNEPVYVSRLLREIDSRQIVTKSELLRVVGGLSGQLDSWAWEVTALSSQESASRWANNALDSEQLANALASSDPRHAINVFQDGAIGSPELIASLVAPPSVARFVSRGSELAATVHGPLLQLPAGSAVAVLGAQWRRETTSSTRTVAIWHAELRLPLWETLEASVGTRSDHFSDVGQVVTPSYSLSWRPVDSLQLRWSYGKNFRPPSADELFGPSYAVQLPIADPRRNGEVGSVTAYVGGSTQLQSVSGKSTAVSVKFTPRSVDGLEIDGNYWITRVSNQIMPVPLALLLENEAKFPERVIRDAATAEDQAAGLPGILRSIDLSTANVGGVQASGIDASVKYGFDTSVGAFKTELSTTWMGKFATLEVPGAQPTNRIGVANARGTIPRWRAFGAVHWRNRLVGASVLARYVAPCEDMSGNRRTGRELRSQTLLDVQASVDLGELVAGIAAFHGVTVTSGALNVLDTPPQFAAVGLDQGYDPSRSDPRQRFGYIRIDKRF